MGTKVRIETTEDRPSIKAGEKIRVQLAPVLQNKKRATRIFSQMHLRRFGDAGVFFSGG